MASSDGDTPQTGDVIVLSKEDGTYDVLRVLDDGQELIGRAGLQSLDYAYAIACASLQGGRVLWRGAAELT